MNEADFADQEPEPMGRGSRISKPTERMQIYSMHFLIFFLTDISDMKWVGI